MLAFCTVVTGCLGAILPFDPLHERDVLEVNSMPLMRCLIISMTYSQELFSSLKNIIGAEEMLQ